MALWVAQRREAPRGCGPGVEEVGEGLPNSGLGGDVGQSYKAVSEAPAAG